MPKQLTIVKWDDAWQDQENFATIHGIKQTHEPMLVETMGVLLVDDETGISIANERSTQDGKDVYRGRSFIPRAMIIPGGVQTFNLTKPSKKVVKREENPPTVPPSLQSHSE